MELHRRFSREIPQVGLAVQHIVVVVNDVRRFRVYPVHRSVGVIVSPVQSSEFRIRAGIPEDVACHRIFSLLAVCQKGMQNHVRVWVAILWGDVHALEVLDALCW
jgi:hypothetical protein